MLVARLRQALIVTIGLLAMIPLAPMQQVWAQQKAPAQKTPAPAAQQSTTAAPTPGQGIDTVARQAIILDYDTGTVLLEKNADDQMVPSSMSKLITVYMVFERLKAGTLKMTDTFTVSETAWRKFYKTDASMMFLPIHARATVGDLLRGVIIQSGNDACSVLAEGIAGDEDVFAQQATAEGRKIGLTQSVFKNASGWPEPGHVMTARDLSTLATRLIHDFPEFYPMFSEKDFAYNNIKQGNRNPLLYDNLGADGLKTGHTSEGGYGLVGSATRDGRRVIVVLNGLPSLRSRSDESAKLLDWAYRNFEDVKLFKQGDDVVDAGVWLGASRTVALTVDRDAAVTLPRGASASMKVSVAYDGPVQAPVTKGQQIATLTVTAPGIPDFHLPLVAARDVPEAGFLASIGQKLGHALHLGG